MRTPRLFTSNRMENLVRALVEVLRTPLSKPLCPELIVVQSKGMERYLSMQIARRLGIWTNCRYLFPNALLNEFFESTLQGFSDCSGYDPDILTWRIMKTLPTLIPEPGFESLRIYLEGEEEDLKKLQLSAAIADAFDQYLLFRPDMIDRWERGEEAHWQARLWRRLNTASERGHRVALARRFLDVLENRSTEVMSLPERISVFGISALPRFHMEILAAVSKYTEVNLFLMNPCQEYWGDIPEDAGLLSSLGKLGRDFLDMVIELGWAESPLFEDPGEDTLLHTIQSDILRLREPGHSDKRRISIEDRTVKFHVCHSPMREVEVLRDQILHMLETNPDLRPGEILVMAPDIRVYAPFIEAVFDLPSSDPTRIPYGIADQGLKEESRIVKPFLSVLNLAGGRFAASEVISILEAPSVSRKFGLSENGLDIIRRWIRETRIRWGMDEQSREDAGAPPFLQNTWRAGLDRLLLGYAMPGMGERMFGDILPYDLVEGSDASFLGNLSEFMEALSGRMRLLQGRKRLQEWLSTLLDVLERFFDPGAEAEREMQFLRQKITELGRLASADAAGFDETIDLKSVLWHLGRTLEQEGFGHGFLGGGITFCSMLPMRSIPFKVICLVGMNNGSYPRESYAPGFDLISSHPRQGDRSRRKDDRYLFLEALLSAREGLYISYVGRSIQDNSVVPPSVLVSELMDSLEQEFEIPGREISDHLTTAHGLQAFSPRYFQGSDWLFSYSEDNCEAARNLMEERRPPVAFISAGLSDPGEEHRTVDLSDLCSFFSNPSRFLLQRRLGLYLGEEVQLEEDKEPQAIEGLERYRLEQDMVKGCLEGRDLGRLFPALKASGLIPPGCVGECLYEDVRRGVERFMDRAGPHIRRECLDSLTLDRRIGGFRVVGKIEGIFPDEVVRYRYARIKGSDFLRAWIIHLALNSFAPEGYPRATRLMGLEERKAEDCIQRRFSPVEGSDLLLERMLGKYWSGLKMPLRFFPETSWTYARFLSLHDNDSREALGRSRKTWAGSEWGRGEREDPYYRICFREEDPLDSEFEKIAVEIFEPMLGYLDRDE